MREVTIKAIGVFFVILIIADLILFILGRISAYWFWFIVIITAIMAYKGLPWLKSKST